MKKQTQNPHTQRIIETKELLSNEKFEQKISAVFSHKPHYSQWKGSYLAALIYSYLSNAFSFLTGAFAIGFILFLQLKNLLPYPFAISLTVSISVAAALLLEVLKRSSNTNFFSTGYADYWSLSTGFAVVGLMLGSIGLSFYASVHLPMASAAAPELENIDSLKTVQLAELTALEEKRNAFRADRLYMGKLASKDAKIVKEYDDDIKELKTSQMNVITAVTARNEATTAIHQTKQNNLGYTLGYISIVLELLFILSFWYQYHFLWNCYLERSKSDENEDTEQKIGFQKFSSSTPGQKAPSAKKTMQINFGEKKTQTPVITSNTAQKLLVKNTVEHTSFVSGKTSQVTAKDIKRNIDTYAQRIEDSLNKLKGTPSELVLKELANRIDKYKYWTSRSLELAENYAQLLE